MSIGNLTLSCFKSSEVCHYCVLLHRDSDVKEDAKELAFECTGY